MKGMFQHLFALQEVRVSGT